MEKLGKTPTQYSGLKPDLDEHFLSYWKKWTDSEKLEYVRYLERDTYRRAFSYIFIFLLFVALLLLGQWIGGSSVD